ncbi:MAG: TIGR03960 family B12-binding radical SAM protein [Syntrophales bacterium]|nr:TIGR03960 family B12-binding radical SAM protein [Syntrophales bacterium]
MKCSLNEILPFVDKPGRYIGGEVNAKKKDSKHIRLRVALAFPDVYEVGMSHLGLQILYALLNNQPDVIAERVFAPWPDMERYLRKMGVPLYTLESGTSLSSFDVIGFSLQYELSFTNVLTMLDLGGIPIRSEDRRNGHPIVIAGGPCAFNPMPMSSFVDAFVIGEGEEVILEIAKTVIEAKDRRFSRSAILKALSELEGVYVPSIHKGAQLIKKRVIADLNVYAEPSSPVVPIIRTIHDRAVLEIARGCTRGCRFCQAGMVWRPIRERNLSVLINMAEQVIMATGYNELSLLSLSSGDYSRIEELLTMLVDLFYERRIALALPSLRVETLTRNMVESIKKVRKTSFTLAPEAGSDRLRRIINKGNTEEELMETLERVFDAGWQSVKLYFMIGLPGENSSDIEGIADIAFKATQRIGKKGEITVNISTFVPKPHTPFQWERQLSLNESKEKLNLLKRYLRSKRFKVKWHSPEMSFLEGIFSRGDEKLCDLVEKAYNLGCRFDAWGDQLNFPLWEKAIELAGIKPESYLGPRRIDTDLPWEFIDTGLTKQFLLDELQMAHQGKQTPDCRFSDCTSCGVCASLRVYNTRAKEKEEEEETDEPKRISRKIKNFRIKYTKEGLARFLSHIDVSQALCRAFCRAGIIFQFSEGFHPHPRISFATATSVGMQSSGEYADIRISPPEISLPELLVKINTALPAGLSVVEMVEVPEKSPKTATIVKGFQYSCWLPKGIPAEQWEDMERRVSEFMGAQIFEIIHGYTDKCESKKMRNIRPLVESLLIDREREVVYMRLALTPEGGVRPIDVLIQVLNIPLNLAKMTKIIKEETFLSQFLLTNG